MQRMADTILASTLPLRLWITAISFTALLSSAVAGEYRVVCYYPAWAGARPGAARLSPQHVNATSCSHLIYAFYDVTATGLIRAHSAEDQATARTLVDHVRRTSPATKVLLSAGGWDEASRDWSVLAAAPERRQVFVSAAVRVLRELGLDGLDVAWLYPTARGGVPGDRDAFTTLLQETSRAFVDEGLRTSRPRLLLTAALAAQTGLLEGYQLTQVARAVDFLSLMTFDYTPPAGEEDDTLALHSALYPRDNDPRPTYNQDWSVSAVLAAGVPAHQLLLGVPAYGRSYTLAAWGLTTPGRDTHSGPGAAGPHTRQPGVLAYYEICSLVQSSGWLSAYDPEQVAMYATNNTQWVGYDGVDSVREKARYVKSRGLGGVMIWDVSMDDFSGTCGDTNPLLTAISSELTSDSENVTPTHSTGSTTHIDAGGSGSNPESDYQEPNRHGNGYQEPTHHGNGYQEPTHHGHGYLIPNNHGNGYQDSQQTTTQRPPKNVGYDIQYGRPSDANGGHGGGRYDYYGDLPGLLRAISHLITEVNTEYAQNYHLHNDDEM